MGAVSAKSIEEEFQYKHDPLEGFSQGRKPRGKLLTGIFQIYIYFLPYYTCLEIKTTLAEMESAKIPLDKRNYCVDYLMKFLDCRSEQWPWVYKCHHEKHEYLHCQYEE